MKKRKKYLLFTLLGLFAALVLWFANGIWGNPVSKLIATRAATRYVDQSYPESDFVIDETFYSFKDSRYHVNVISPTSKDSYFTVSVSGSGQIKHDTYDSITDGWNTYLRLEKQYRDLVNSVFSSWDFPLVSHIDFGELAIFEPGINNNPVAFSYGVNVQELELDKEYDITELAKTAGHIVFYAQHEEVTFENAARLLLLLKQELSDADIPFYAVDFILELPHTENGMPREDTSEIRTSHFLYEDIYEEGLAERIKENHTVLTEYYAVLDAELAKQKLEQ